MKQFNFTKVLAVFAAVLLGMATKAEAHAGNTSADVVHACVNPAGAIRVVGVNGKCKAKPTKEMPLHLALVGKTYVLGDDGPDGGIVYYVDGSGEHGLEAQVADEPTTLDWASAVTAAAAYGTGWHLPTKTELELLYEQKAVVGGFADPIYWSSTEHLSVTAWYQTFVNGSQSYYVKSGSYRVRSVRAF